LSIFAAKAVSDLKNKWIALIVILYLAINVASIHPFYLSYFNELTGFTFGAFNSNYFKIGTWGEGIGEAIEYLNNNAEINSTAQLFVMPNPLYYGLRKDIGLKYPGSELEADYIIMNSNCYDGECSYDWAKNTNPKISFNDIENSGYNLIYEINAMGAPLAKIYKKE
jgi:hypothetical protein